MLMNSYHMMDQHEFVFSIHHIKGLIILRVCVLFDQEDMWSIANVLNPVQLNYLVSNI